MQFFDLHCDTAYKMYTEKQGFYENNLAVSGQKGEFFENWHQTFAVWLPEDLENPFSFYKNTLLHLKQNNYQIDKNISSLLYHDLNNNTDFCLTLYTYIICNHSLKKTAENLHAHSNTVLYRIQKAKDEFEIDTDNSELHFYYLISLALCLLELGHEDIFILSDK